MTMLITDNAGF